MKILIYPASENPYHELLYKPMRQAHSADTFSYLPASAFTVALFPFVAMLKRLRGYKVFHLHWHAFYLDKKYRIPGSAFISLVTTIVSLTVLRLLRYKLLWTVHNVLPHEPQTSNDRFVTRYTAKLAHTLIAHSGETIEQLKALGVDTSKVVINPHGSYVGAHPVNITRAKARARLTIKPREQVILFFGNIRPYKGIETLLAAYEQLDRRSGVRLIVAGKVLDDSLGDTIKQFTKRHPTTIVTGSVPDEMVATYFMAADVACLPFTNVTTSGSVLLAATFGIPIVAPKIGAIKDIPEAVGTLYNPAVPDPLTALTHALQTVLNSSDQGRKAMSKAAASYARSLTWDTIAARTYDLYI